VVSVVSQLGSCDVMHMANWNAYLVGVGACLLA
jgi:hypothetical protein